MNHSDIAALMKGVAPVIAELVTTSMQPLVDQISALKQEVAELRGVDYAATVADLVADAVGRIVLPTPEPGKDADPDETRRLVDEAVKAAIDALPPPEPGKPGEVDLLVLAAMVDEAVSKLPPAEPGKSVTVKDVQPILAELVADAVAALPPVEPKEVDPVALNALVNEAVSKLPPAEPGKSVTVEDVTPLIEQLVKSAVADIPAAEPGESVTVEDVEPMLAEMVDKAVAALPPPEPGPPGMLPLVKAWEDRVWREAECCTFGGSTYQARTDTGKAPPHADWICIAAAGEPGNDADQIEVRETYDPEGAYRRLNIVALNGAAFIARKDDPGPCPGEGWQVIAMRGKPGPVTKGEPGKSVRGEPGPPVVTMSIDGEGLLTLVNGDGSRVECDLYPVLAKIAG